MSVRYCNILFIVRNSDLTKLRKRENSTGFCQLSGMNLNTSTHFTNTSATFLKSNLPVFGMKCLMNKLKKNTLSEKMLYVIITFLLIMFLYIYFPLLNTRFNTWKSILRHLNKKGDIRLNSNNMFKT